MPFFAPRAGELPKDGAPVVGGIKLPRGSRCPTHWATDAATPDAIFLARQLAAEFPRTGLWPLIWIRWEDPDAYVYRAGDPALADRIDVEPVLRRLWNGFTPPTKLPPFPGLAPAVAGAGTGPVATDPFAALSDYLATPPPTSYVLVLVSVNRPADAISTMGFVQTEVMPDAAVTAVVRSWEERFGAVLVFAGPGEMGLRVDAPPRAERDVVRLAAEHNAFAPDNATTGGPDGLLDLIRSLKTGNPYPTTLREQRVWDFGWPD